jgi:hypothetical protein
MALILAIEPDRRQAARISALGRGTLDAEVLVADSTERGVAALHGRHPDLILTSLLLSPKDEAGLREFEKGGVPVPTLMIPVLSGSSRGSHAGSGLLARLQRKPAVQAPAEGCDPKVFAAQVAEYLSHAREERELLESDDDLLMAALDPVPATIDDIRTPAYTAPAAVDAHAVPASIEEEFIETEAAVETAAIDESEPFVETIASAPVTSIPVDAPIIEAPIALMGAIETFATARPQADADWEEIVIEEHEEPAERVDVDDDFTIHLSSDSDLQAFVDELKATYADLFPVQEVQTVQQVQQVLTNEPFEPFEPVEPIESRARVAIAHALPYRASWPSIEGIAAEDAPLFDEVVADFVAAMDEPENRRGGDADSDLWMPLSSAPGLAWPRLESACSKRPSQDEWGFYDPDQCGLSAVVAKLDQVTR